MQNALSAIRSQMIHAGPVNAEARTKVPDYTLIPSLVTPYSVPFRDDSFEHCGMYPGQVRIKNGHGNFIRFSDVVYVHIDYTTFIRWPAGVDFPFAHFPMRFVTFTVPKGVQGLFIAMPSRDDAVRHIAEELRLFL